MRQGGEEQVSVGERAWFGRHEDPVLQARVTDQLREHRGHRRPGAAVRRDGPDLQVGMAGQQAEQLTARVAASPRDRYLRTQLPASSSSLEEYSR